MSEGLQRYAIMEPLGAGAQGSTFRGIDRDRGEPVAIKVLQLTKQIDWRAFDRFEQEVEVLRGLDHPGIPRFRASFASEASGDYFLVMDLVEGPSLASLMHKPGAFDEARLRSILLGLFEVLEYLHGRTPAVIHRDIKPANVLLVGERVVLVDFGGVRVATIGRGITRIGTAIGTFGYMAPEQLHGEATVRSDLYGVGATIVALATGTEADALPHAGLAIDFEAIRVPASLRPLLEVLLKPDPRERPASVAHARALLEGRAHASAPPPRPTSTTADLPALPDPPIPGIIQELADTPRPLSILVWLFALMGAGGLIVFEFAILPIVYVILRASADRKRDRGQAIDDRQSGLSSLREFREQAGVQRRMIEHVIQGTSPLREDRPSLPPGPDR
ncbi:serine/threonine protein kinase [Nannocystaceae bacterium ST9]